jgi:hypothetical protein
VIRNGGPDGNLPLRRVESEIAVERNCEARRGAGGQTRRRRILRRSGQRYKSKREEDNDSQPAHLLYGRQRSPQKKAPNADSQAHGTLFFGRNNLVQIRNDALAFG